MPADKPPVSQSVWEGPDKGLLPYEAMLKLALYPDALKEAMIEIMSDIATRVPHHVGKAVSQLYAVRTLAALKRRAPNSPTKFTEHGDTRLTVRGSYEKNLWLEFTGSVTADWPVKANGKKKLPRWKKVRASKRKGINAHYVRQPYTLTREILRGKWTALTPQTQGVRIFAITRGKSLIPMAIAPGWSHPLAMGGTSIPQAIIQPATVKVWEPPVLDLIRSRSLRAISRHLP